MRSARNRRPRIALRRSSTRALIAGCSTRSCCSSSSSAGEVPCTAKRCVSSAPVLSAPATSDVRCPPTWRRCGCECEWDRVVVRPASSGASLLAGVTASEGPLPPTPFQTLAVALNVSDSAPNAAAASSGCSKNASGSARAERRRALVVVERGVNEVVEVHSAIGALLVAQRLQLHLLLAVAVGINAAGARVGGGV